MYEGRVTKGLVQLSCTGSRYQCTHETFYDFYDDDGDDDDDDTNELHWVKISKIT